MVFFKDNSNKIFYEKLQESNSESTIQGCFRIYSSFHYILLHQII